jgi:hypothetical protein
MVFDAMPLKEPNNGYLARPVTWPDGREWRRLRSGPQRYRWRP